MAYNKNDIKISKKRLDVRAKRGNVNIEIYPKKTGNHFYLVVYDCIAKRELFCFSTLNLVKERKVANEKEFIKNNTETAAIVGQKVAAWCLENKISAVYFNKLKYKFHGKLASAVGAFNETFNK